MDTAQLTRVLMADDYVRPYFAGVCAHDQLRTRLTRARTHKAVAVFNLDPSHLPGSHWVAVHLNFSTESADYFDPMGLPPDPACRQLLQDLCPRKPLRFNDIKLQDNTQVCGQFCIVFLKYRCRGYTFDEGLHQLDFKGNDRAVHDLIKTWIPKLPYKL